MAYLLALLSAAGYGAADFVGGLTARRTSTLAAVLVTQAAGLALLVAVLPWLPPSSPSVRDFVWGGVAGLMGSIGVGLLYRALAIGTMAIVAPLTAVCAVAIPVFASLMLGEQIGAFTAAGILLAAVAIVLVSQQPSDRATQMRPPRLLPTGVAEALCSGVAIGFFFLALARTGPTAGLWPLVASRGVGAAVFAMAAVVRRAPVRMSGPALLLASGGGALDMTANALYLIATRYGALSGVVTLSSLYPASTVLLARIVLGERLGPLQVAGVACALAAVTLIVGV